MTNNFLEKFSKHTVTILTPLFVILILVSLYKVYEFHNKYHLTAKFSQSGPLYKDMPVYFRGYKIGKIKEITLTEDYKYTLAQIVFFPKTPKLPEDVVAKVKNHNIIKQYIDLEVSDTPSDILLKDGSTIDGEGIFDLNGFLSDIADSGLIVPLLQTFQDTLTNAGKTSDEIRNFFSDSRNILKDNRQNIKQSTKNLATSSNSLTKITSNFDKTSLKVDKTSDNILSASEDVKNITKSIDCATRDIDKTVAKIDCTVSEANEITTNVKTITSGFCEILNKRFAGFRIIFGKPLNKGCKCPKNCFR